MIKYDMSKIMTTAWNIRKATGLDMSASLKLSWARAKASAEEQKKVPFTGRATLDGFEFVTWEKYGKRRIYINNYSGHNRRNDGGYINLDNNNHIVATGCVKDAARKFMATYAI